MQKEKRVRKEGARESERRGARERAEREDEERHLVGKKKPEKRYGESKASGKAAARHSIA